MVSEESQGYQVEINVQMCRRFDGTLGDKERATQMSGSNIDFGGGTSKGGIRKVRGYGDEESKVQATLLRHRGKKARGPSNWMKHAKRVEQARHGFTTASSFVPFTSRPARVLSASLSQKRMTSRIGRGHAIDEDTAVGSAMAGCQPIGFKFSVPPAACQT